MPRRSSDNDSGGPFSAETLAFLAELERNNDREWFNANKARYEASLLDPALRFIERMQAPLERIAPHFRAVPKRSGGSLMRIYRDTRFARDKTPYKTNIGIQFRHEEGRDVHAPGFYVHVDTGQAFLGVGLWRPPPPALGAIRQRIDARPGEWRRARDDRRFRRHFTLGGESLKRPPRGYAADHPLIDDLRRRDFIAVKPFDPEAALRRGFERRVETAFAASAPFMRFLCDAVGVPW